MCVCELEDLNTELKVSPSVQKGCSTKLSMQDEQSKAEFCACAAPWERQLPQCYVSRDRGEGIIDRGRTFHSGHQSLKLKVFKAQEQYK